MSTQRTIDDAELAQVAGAGGTGENVELQPRFKIASPPDLDPIEVPIEDALEGPDTDDQNNGNQNFGG